MPFLVHFNKQKLRTAKITGFYSNTDGQNSIHYHINKVVIPTIHRRRTLLKSGRAKLRLLPSHSSFTSILLNHLLSILPFPFFFFPIPSFPFPSTSFSHPVASGSRLPSRGVWGRVLAKCIFWS